MRLNIDNWNDVSIKKYFDINDILQDEDTSDFDKAIELVAVLNDVSIDDVMRLPVTEMANIWDSLLWLFEFDYPKTIKNKHIKVGRFETQIDTNIANMTVAQYVDFQQYWGNMPTDTPEAMADLLSVFLVPSNHKYGEGYDIDELKDCIINYMSIVDYNTIAFFLLTQLVTSILDMTEYCQEERMRMERQSI